MRTVYDLMISLSLLGALSAQAAPLDLKGVGIDAATGSGHVNGSEMDVIVVQGSTLYTLKTKLGGAYTVKEVEQNGQKTLLVIDLKAGAPKPDEAAYVFSATSIADDQFLIIGTPLAPLARGLRSGPSKYHGTALPALPDGARLDVETGFTFGQAKVDTSQLTVATSPAMARSLFVEHLARAGFDAMESPSETSPATAPLGFRKGQTVVHVLVNAGASGSEAKVILHEVSVP
jgi:hypothetical protein